MTTTFKQIYSAFKKKPDIWFFYMFLATSTLSIRKVLYYFPIDNSFNEYTGIYIYLSDIFLILTFISFILCNNNILLSNTHTFLLKYHHKLKLFHVEQLRKKFKSESNCSMWNNLKSVFKIVPRGTLLLIRKTYTQLVNNYSVIFPLSIAFFSFISILWTTNHSIAVFKSIKLLEYVLLYFYIIAIVPRGTIGNLTSQFSKISNKMFHVEQFSIFQKAHSNKVNQANCSTWNNSQEQVNVPRGTFLAVIAIGVIQSIIGIIQFTIQQSIGLFWLKESIISPIIPGVAKVILNGHTYIRAYGLFPHPNILGGFLALSIITTLLYLKLFHVEQFNKNISSKNNCSTPACPVGRWNNWIKWVRNVPRGTFLMRFTILIQCTALILTFSKSAIFGLSLGLFYVFHQTHNNNVPRGTLFTKFKTFISMFHVEHFARKLALIASIFILLFILIKPEINSLFIKSLQERELYLNVSYATFISHPLVGIGTAQFVPNMTIIYTLPSWQYQPVHNVFLLILNEFGIFFMFGFIYFIYKMFHARPHRYAKRFGQVEHFNTKEDINVPRGTFIRLKTHTRAILLSFIFIMLFDHYFWDIQQGQILLWLLLGLLVSQNKIVVQD